MLASDPEHGVVDAPEFTEGHIHVGSIAVRYLSAGRGEPLVLVHGRGGLDLTIGQRLLARDFHVVALEIPGFGENDDTVRTEVGAVVDLLADSVAALGLHDHGLLGTSMGGVVALWWAVRRGEAVRTMVLEAPAAFRTDAAPHPATFTPAEFMRAFHRHPERKHLQAPDPARVMRTAALAEQLMGPPFDTALAEAVTALDVPVLVLFGTEDGLIPPATGRTYKTLIPRASYVLVHDAAHDLSGDRPESFADVVADFLRRGDAFVVPLTSTVIHR